MSHSREDSLSELRGLRQRAPCGFTGRVMKALPNSRAIIRLFPVWPHGLSWLPPALACAAAAVLITLYFAGGKPYTAGIADTIVVRFELHAPHAGQVELVGDFTSWQPGRIHLEGPDQSGYWTTRIELPAGLHEYMFLIDGKEWTADPQANAYRPDGFGNLNAILHL